MVGKEEREKIQEFYIRYEKILLGYAVRLVKSQAIAEDAVHDTFVTVLQKAKTFCESTSEQMFCWCIVVLKNKCIDQLRRQKKFSDTPVDSMFLLLEEAEASPEEQVIKKENLTEMEKVFESIDPLSRQILKMKYCLELSYREIAKELGVSRKFVDNRIMLSKRKIQNQRNQRTRKRGKGQ